MKNPPAHFQRAPRWNPRMVIGNGFELAPEAVFAQLQSVYMSTDAFANDFSLEYPSVAALSRRLDRLRTRPGSLFLVAGANDRILGYVFIVPRKAAKLRHTADLHMGVSREARGQGVGTMLLRGALKQLRDQRIIELVYLMVRADNLPAVQLYKAQGFEHLATLDRDIKIGIQYFDGLLLRWSLPMPKETGG